MEDPGAPPTVGTLHRVWRQIIWLFGGNVQTKAQIEHRQATHAAKAEKDAQWYADNKGLWELLNRQDQQKAADRQRVNQSFWHDKRNDSGEIQQIRADMDMESLKDMGKSEFAALSDDDFTTWLNSFGTPDEQVGPTQGIDWTDPEVQEILHDIEPLEEEIREELQADLVEEAEADEDPEPSMGLETIPLPPPQKQPIVMGPWFPLAIDGPELPPTTSLTSLFDAEQTTTMDTPTDITGEIPITLPLDDYDDYDTGDDGPTEHTYMITLPVEPSPEEVLPPPLDDDEYIIGYLIESANGERRLYVPVAGDDG